MLGVVQMVTAGLISSFVGFHAAWCRVVSRASVIGMFLNGTKVSERMKPLQSQCNNMLRGMNAVLFVTLPLSDNILIIHVKTLDPRCASWTSAEGLHSILCFQYVRGDPRRATIVRVDVLMRSIDSVVLVRKDSGTAPIPAHDHC